MPKKHSRSAAKSNLNVKAHKHQDARPNIPTRELAPFAADDESKAKKILYPRDPSLDPQLVWKGKDEQDRHPLEVPAVPIYIQEKIHPQAIIEDLKQRASQAGKKETHTQPDLFADFNGLDDFQKKIDFYHHDQHWTNRFILGDSLLVMTSLAEKERLKGQVQCIYFDPPYGIKFGSNWQVSTRKRDVKDSKAEDTTRQPEQIKAFRDTWKLGIHSYLTYLRDRLTVARKLLTESGSIFVQIGEENVHLVRCLMDEVFGSDNHVSQITFLKTSSSSSDRLASTADILLWFAKDNSKLKYRQLHIMKDLTGEGGTAYGRVVFPDGTSRTLKDDEKKDTSLLPKSSRIYRLDNLTSQRPAQEGDVLSFEFKGKKYTPGKGTFKTDLKGLTNLANAYRVDPTQGNLYYVRYFDDFPCLTMSNVWSDTIISGFGEKKTYVVQTSTKVIERCILMTTDPGDLVIDPTCGSGSTANVAEEWGRRWITIDTSRVALSLARTRLMAGKFPYYLLNDSPEGRRKEWELTNTNTTLAPDSSPASYAGDIRKGFIYKRVPHVTLKSIANNPDIKPGMTREQIDAAIAQHADTETLYDQPYEDKNTIRVTGPFTVESLSPHRMLPTVEDEAKTTQAATENTGNYLITILDNLRKAGVKGMEKRDRIAFERLDNYPGEYIQAEGSYLEGTTSRSVRVSVGPEFGTVGPEWINAAAREAIKGSRCDLLLVCGFSFDPHVHEQTDQLKKEMQFGKLRILPVRMNPDLAMGDELLKKTGAGNLFMVFGEPDIEIAKDKKSFQYNVTIKGLDVYDPTTGEVRSNSTDDIACWFIDTNYDDQSFFVRHAYFCGGDEPYEKLKRALRAEVDEAEWSKLYSTVSLPFDAPSTGKIAVKVINHYGDEVLKVYKVS